jgi:RHS repeat-associated protein
MPDQLGSVRDVIDATTGTRVKSYDYTAYGKTARNNGTGDTDYRYAGLWAHPQSGLNLAVLRAQDPATGRWINRDPIREIGGLNLYGYVKQNPIKWLDPMGLETFFFFGRIPPEIMSEEAIPPEAIPPKVTPPEAMPLPPAGGACPKPPFPYPTEPTTPPGPGWEWRGNGPVGSDKGAWYKPETGESLHPDLNHGEGIPPHYDYTTPRGEGFRWFPNGTMEPKIVITPQIVA